VKTFALAALALSGCALAYDYDEAQDADPADEEKADVARQTCETVRCGNPRADVILFPGNPACGPAGCERGLAGEDIYIPPRNGRPWGDTYEEGALPARVIAGYSSGRIALLRRLALFGDGQHAVMIDPSWYDGARDFLGQGPIYGDTLVHTWLSNDPSRTFTLIYSKRSAGWKSYADLQRTDVGARVRVCVVTEPHLLVPTVKDLATALVDPLAWDNGTCTLGAGG
jgi:hypothetical protein